jgi:hypothetical protein
MPTDLMRRGRFLDSGGAILNVRARYPDSIASGTVDASDAINATLDRARKLGEYGDGERGMPVYLPPGTYRLDNALDMTLGQFHLIGAGPYQTRLVCNNGGVAVDMTGGGYSLAEGLLLDVAGASNPSTCGILQARYSNAASAPGLNVRRCVVRMGTDPAANNGNGTVGVYNYGSEETDYDDVTLRGDTGLYLGAGNLFGITSPHTSILDADTSMTAVQVRGGGSALLGIRGPALHLAGGGQATIHAFMSNHAAMFSVAQYDYAIRSTSIWIGLTYEGSVESYFRWLRQEGTTIRGVDADVYLGTSTGEHLIWLQHASLVDGNVSWRPTTDALLQSPWIVDAAAGGTSGVYTSTLRGGANKGIRTQGTGVAQGNHLMSQSNVADIDIAGFALGASGNIKQGLDDVVTAA